jgi:hypothetical protein
MIARHTADHVRAGGDDNGANTQTGEEVGLHPRLRGRRAGQQVGAEGVRTTPAYAGTTTTCIRSGDRSREYHRVRGDDTKIWCRVLAWKGPPRMREDDLMMYCNCGCVLGPPPHARGQQHQGAEDVPYVWTSPACAGTTRPTGSPSPAPLDHPCVRRAGADGAAFNTFTTGPPPRARGRRYDNRVGVERVRTTPACAGTTNDAGGITDVLNGPPPRARGRRLLTSEVRK